MVVVWANCEYAQKRQWFNRLVMQDYRFSHGNGKVCPPILAVKKVLRSAQDRGQRYGRLVRAFRVDELTPERYAEGLANNVDILGPVGHGWNAASMHHLDAHETGANKRIACVDGRRPGICLPPLDRISPRIRGEIRS